MRISMQPSPVKIMIDHKQLENLEYFNYVGSVITNNIRCTAEINYRISFSRATFNKKRALFTCKLDVKETSKMLHLEHSFVWC
jgi:hypothetical protein